MVFLYKRKFQIYRQIDKQMIFRSSIVSKFRRTWIPRITCSSARGKRTDRYTACACCAGSRTSPVVSLWTRAYIHMHVHGRTRRTRVGASQWNRSTSRTKLASRQRFSSLRRNDKSKCSLVVSIAGKKSRAIDDIRKCARTERSPLDFEKKKKPC